MNKMDYSEFDAYITITGFRHYFVYGKVDEGFEVVLVREFGNIHDEYAIAVYSKGEKIGYVANSPDTVRKGSMSARQLTEQMKNNLKAEIIDFSSYDALCRVDGVYDIDKMCSKAFEYLNNAEYKDALELLFILNEKFNSEMTNQYVAECLINLGRCEESLQYCEVALKTNPEQPSSLMMRGVALTRLGQYEKALIDFDLLREKHNKNANVYRERAICYAKMGKAIEAKADLQKSIELDPKNLITLRVKDEIMSL